MEKSATPPRDTEVVDYDDTKKVAPPMDDGVMAGEISGEVSDMDTSRADLEKQKTAEGTAHFNRLGWKRLTVVLIVEAIALGSLSLPKVFATLGMVAGVILCVGLGLLAIWTSDMVGQVKLRFPEVAHYADAGKLVAGRWGYEIVGAMFAAQLIFLVGSHCLTGTIAFNTIIDKPGVCKVIYGVVSAILLLFVAIPPSFAEVAILGYIDFVSILLAIGLTIIATGIQSNQSIGLSNVNWSAWPKEGITFTEAFISISNIVFAYSFSMCQFSFMDEMHTLKDYKKSIWALGLTEILLYTLTGSLIYAFVGQEVQAPALLSAQGVIPRIAFGIALPVIFISGSINTVVVGRYIHGRMYKDSITRFINTPKGWTSWLILITIVTIVAFLIAEVIPIFEDLLSISSSLFISGFSFYFPAIMWYCLLREGPWYARHNWLPAFLNIVCFIVGIVVLVAGTYASVDDIILSFRNHSVSGVFQC